MLERITLAVFSVLFFVNAVHGEIRLILRPKVIVENNLLMSDIASIEAGYSDIEKIKNIIIESSFYQDGYIDKKEITLLLKKHTADNISIYGNAVRVISYGQYNKFISDDQQTQMNDFLLRKGDQVDIVVKKNGISILLKGIAVNEGKINDEVSIKLQNKSGTLSKLVKGRIKGRDLVEINI